MDLKPYSDRIVVVFDVPHFYKQDTLCNISDELYGIVVDTLIPSYNIVMCNVAPKQGLFKDETEPRNMYECNDLVRKLLDIAMPEYKDKENITTAMNRFYLFLEDGTFSREFWMKLEPLLKRLQQECIDELMKEHEQNGKKKYHLLIDPKK
jgi:hypothetical protein